MDFWLNFFGSTRVVRSLTHSFVIHSFVHSVFLSLLHYFVHSDFRTSPSTRIAYSVAIYSLCMYPLLPFKTYRFAIVFTPSHGRREPRWAPGQTFLKKFTFHYPDKLLE